MADNKNGKQPPKVPKGQGPNRPDDNFDWSKIIRMVLGWGAVIFAAVIVMQVLKTGQENYVDIPFAEYRRLLNETDKIKDATIT
ncbi:MAG: cell division protein FtsH, partial [Ignavibacteriaceae bacterium]|nr:cell division protein FtsH [Ignavibacteriaceae bacterium]